MGVGGSQQITSYRAYVDMDNGFGGIIVRMDAGPAVHLRTKDMAVYAAAVDLLRNEKPVFYDRERQFLQTGSEPVGEGE